VFGVKGHGMKKRISLLIVAGMLFSICACGNLSPVTERTEATAITESVVETEFTTISGENNDGHEPPAQLPSEGYWHDETEASETVTGWIGTWTADTGEYLEIYEETDIGISLHFSKIVESSTMIVDYELEFDNEDRTIASEIGDVAAMSGWEYVFTLEDGQITVQSRYPDQVFVREG